MEIHLSFQVMTCFFSWQIYDVATGTKLMTLFDDDKANNYKANMATFSPTDDLVLNDGVLWDVRCCKPLHKFDKFNQFISGVFHPQGLEIIINSEVVSFVHSGAESFRHCGHAHIMLGFVSVTCFCFEELCAIDRTLNSSYLLVSKILSVTSYAYSWFCLGFYDDRASFSHS